MRAKRLLTMLVIVTFSVASGACYSVKYATNRRPQPVEYRVTNHFFLGGLVGNPRVNLAANCPDGVASAEVVHTFLDLLASGLTMWLWSPTTTKYRCAEGEVQSFAPGADHHIANADTEER